MYRETKTTLNDARDYMKYDINAVIMMEYKDPEISLHGIDSEVIEDIYRRILDKKKIIPYDYRVYFLGQKNEYRLYRQYDVVNLTKKQIVEMYIDPFFNKYKEAFKLKKNLYPKYFLDWLQLYIETIKVVITEISNSIDSSRKTDVINRLQRFWETIPTFYVLREIFMKTSAENIFVMAEGHYSKITCMLEEIYTNKDSKISSIDPAKINGCISVSGPKRMGTSDLYRDLPDVLKRHIIDEYVDLPAIEAQIAMVTEEPYALDDIKNPHPDVSMAAVKEYGGVLKFVKDQTPEIAMVAVKGIGMALEHVNPSLWTPELFMEAVKQNGRALQFVRPDLQTPELCLAAVKQIPYALKFVRDDLQTPELCMVAVKKDGYALEYVNVQTPELCMEAVKNNGRALQFVRPDLQTPEMCMIAVKNSPFSIKFVRDDLYTIDLVMYVINKAGLNLKFVKTHLQTPEIAMAAVKKDGRALKFVREDLQTHEIAMAAVKQNRRAFEWVRPDLRI